MSENNPASGDDTGTPAPALTEASKPAAPAAAAPVNLRTVPLDFWHKLRFLAGYLLGTLILMLGLVLGLAQAAERSHDFKLVMAISVGLVLLGAFVLWCAKARYLGGIRSFLGAATAIAGFECLLSGLWDTLQAGYMDGAGVIAGLFLLFIGGSLLFLGRQVHRDRWKYLLVKAKAASDPKARLEMQLARMTNTDRHAAEAYFWLGLPLIILSAVMGAAAVAGGACFIPPGLGGLVLGFACVRWYYRPYRGGMATITGVCLLYFGLFMFAAVLENLTSPANLPLLVSALGGTAGGGFLLWAGHQLHRRRTRFLNEELLPALKAIESGEAPAGQAAGTMTDAPQKSAPTPASAMSRKISNVVYHVFSISLLLGGLLLAWGILRAGAGQPLLLSCALVMLGAGSVLAWWTVNRQTGGWVSLAGLLLSALALALLGTTMEIYVQLKQADAGFLILTGGIGIAGLIGGLLLVAAGYDLAAPQIEAPAEEAPAARWTQRWRPFGKRLAITAGVLVLLCLVENGHGWFSWRSLHQELTAAGEHLDWKDFIPPPVPDEQNFAAAEIFQQWPLMKTGYVAQAQSSQELLPHPPYAPGYPITIAAMKAAANQFPNQVDLRQLKAPAAFDEIQDAIMVNDVGLLDALKMVLDTGGVKWAADDTNALSQVKVTFAFHKLSARATAVQLCEAHTLAAYQNPGDETIHITSSAALFNAAQVLAWYKLHGTNLASLYAAAARPHARLNTDFSYEIWSPIPNFVRLRTVGQSLATHANAALLTGAPEAALLDLQVIEKEALASSTHPTLVGAMISVALHGLAGSVIEDGLAEGAWREPQLVALQKSLAQTDLPALARFGLESERARVCATIQFSSRKWLGGLLVEEALAPEKYWGQRVGIWPRLLARVQAVGIQIVPRGWIYQNQCAIARHYRRHLIAAGLASGKGAISQPAEMSTFELSGWSYLCPYRFLTPKFSPNFSRAGLTAKRNQAILDMARTACALERHRLARGEYPAALASLVPQFVEQVPTDVMDRQPLHYRRTPDSRYLLYSVGENRADDGGIGSTNRYLPESKEWVWQGVPK